MIDIIIPVYNEETVLSENAEYYQNLGQRSNIIFVDGGSRDATREIAARYGRVVSSQKGRWIQKNTGAAETRTGSLLFLHVDTYVDPDAVQAAEQALSDGAAAGCFQMRIQDPRMIFRVFEHWVNMRARIWRATDGDSGLFIRKEVFDRVNGFPQAPYMEDLLIGRKLKQHGRFQALRQGISVSSRKWDQQGFGRLAGKYTRAYVTLLTGRLQKS